MKKLLILLSIIFLSGCGILDRGNYDKNRTGYVLSENLIVKYHTNSIGEIDVFQIDQVMSFFEAIDYIGFDSDSLSDYPAVSSYVTTTELLQCEVSHTSSIPRFIRIQDQTYFYNIRDNGYCTYDEYEFLEEGATNLTEYVIEDVSPVQNLNITLFKETDFKVNTFEDIIFIEEIYYDNTFDIWVKEIVTVLPMSFRQAGSIYSCNCDFVEEVTIIERYVLNNQSINLLVLKDNYTDEDINNIWSDYTIDILGRDHELIKTVRLSQTQSILDIINDTLSRLGLFQ